MNAEPIIHFDALSKYYGKHPGIESLSFSIDKGEIFGFLGPNGAGKTTTIRLMLDLLKPDSGHVFIFGKEVQKASFHIRQRLGYLPGDFMPYDRMSGEEFLRFSSRLRNIAFPDSASLIDRFELSVTDLKKKIRAYSQGMKQKLGIIHACMHNPELIILDEPSAGLDPLMQEALYGLLIERNHAGTTIFFSSHNLPEVEKICGRVAIVKEAKLVGCESLDTLRKRINRKVIISLENPESASPELRNARLLTRHQLRLEYLITGPIDLLLQELAGIPLTDIAIPEPDLEEIFLSYYEKTHTLPGKQV